MCKLALAFLALAYVCAGSPRKPFPREWDAFQVSFANPGTGLGYYDLPWTVQEATAQKKWQKIEFERKLNVDLYSQPEDPRTILLFDRKGNIAGIRMSFLKEDNQSKDKPVYQFDNNPMYEMGNYFSKDLWHTTVLFTSPTRLASGGRWGLNKETDSIAESLYFKRHGMWIEMSKDECQPRADFTDGNCISGMGQHYFHQLDRSEDCKHSQPFFTLYNNGRLIGFGLAGYGSFSKHPNTQSYYDDVRSGGGENFSPQGPPCWRDNVRTYGLTSMHVYLKKGASKLTCPTQNWRTTNC